MSTKELRLSKSGSNSSTQTGYQLATNTWLRKHPFTAKLTPSEGKLGLDVNFYERGLFPPAAYHSEGHQDGMGVCLYLALMKRLFGDRFSLSLLDDVVMSVEPIKHSLVAELCSEFQEGRYSMRRRLQ